MVGSLLLALLGLALFYFQNLVLYPYVHVRLLSLLVFAVGLRQPLGVAAAVAVPLGLLQDAYALTPLGLHLSGALILLATARSFQRRLLLAGPGSQTLAAAGALALEEVFLRLTLAFVGLPALPWRATGGVAILATALLAPLIFAGLKHTDLFLRRLGWRSLREQE